MSGAQAKSRPVLTRTAVFAGAVPIMLANASPALVGLVDTWVIGQNDSTIALAAIGLGATIYGIFYWGFGFLRMSTAGLSAQADGEDDNRAVQSHLLRAVPLGMVIGLLIFVLQALLLGLIMPIFPAEAGVSAGARDYIGARLWGLPATLGGIALMGWFIGLARPSLALIMQIVINLINAPLSILFVASYGWGVQGVGWASAIADWIGLVAGLGLAAWEIGRRGGFDAAALKLSNLLDGPALKTLATANSNIFIRTVALTIGFTFFTYAATAQGTVFLAAHNVLLQFITLMALVLDAFANVAEAHVGAAYGARSEKRFDRAVRLTTEFSAFFAVILGAMVYFGGPYLVDMITPDPAVRDMARTYLPYCAMVPIAGFAAWQIDGIYIGITRTAAMRNAGVVAVGLYLAAHFTLEPIFGGAGVWLAFLFYYVMRALTMLPAWPNIKRDVRATKIKTEKV